MLPSLLHLSKDGPKHWQADWSLYYLILSLTFIFQAKCSTGISVDMPPHTPASEYYFTASPHSVIHPPGKDTICPDPPATAAPSAPVVDMPTITAVGGSGLPSNPDPNVLFSSLSTLLLTQAIRTLQAMESPTPIPQSGPIPRLPINTYPNGCPPIDESRLYPKIDELFEDLASQDPGHNIGLMLTKLVDAGLYRIDEIYTSTEEKLKGMGLLQGEADWLLRKVKHAILSLE